MRTVKQICLYDKTIEDSKGKELHLKRGEEYITTIPNKENSVTVFSSYWANVPAEWFGGMEDFTE